MYVRCRTVYQPVYTPVRALYGHRPAGSVPPTKDAAPLNHCFQETQFSEPFQELAQSGFSKLNFRFGLVKSMPKVGGVRAIYFTENTVLHEIPVLSCFLEALSHPRAPFDRFP